ncbi:MAG TPA: AraC family transcriptional regulator [Kiloniellales bacterium]|nr:AraC family transcriptional regulator [Kiloniellales bacterium]
MDALKAAVRAYAACNATTDGIALTPLPGVRMMCRETPSGDIHAVYKPMVCVVLQGAKHMIVGRQERIVTAGQTVIVSADMPVVGRILRASREQPYLAVSVELEMATLRELAAHTRGVRPQAPADRCTLFTEDTEAAVTDCIQRLIRLLDRPEDAWLLSPGILRELHYWLLAGPHGPALLSMADPDGHAERLSAAIVILRDEYRLRIPVERLASAAAMSLSAFHKHFKSMTSLTPGQYQKRLRLIEARRLLLEEGFTASNAAFEVGYESVSQFTREYGRLFEAPPKRDALRYRRPAAALLEDSVPATAAPALSAW